MSFRNLCLIAIAAVLGAACATNVINLPSVTDSPTGDRLPGKIIWRELLTHDLQASQRFYKELFGWEFENVGSASGLASDSTYSLIRHNGDLIGGMIDTVALNGRDDISQWVILMSVNDVDAAAAKFSEDGGEVVTPPTDLQRRGRIAVVRDAEGALLGLLQTRDGDPADREPEIGGFLWDELWTTDVEGATAFYRNVAGFDSADWDIDENQETGASYRLLTAADTPRAGIMPNPLEGLGPVWVSYLRVADPSAITARVAGLGGNVIVEAQPRPLGGQVAFIAGPSGAGIALQTWPLEENNQEM
jgi:predicted enzyme related to lactoylglutathione lyase